MIAKETIIDLLRAGMRPKQILAQHPAIDPSRISRVAKSIGMPPFKPGRDIGPAKPKLHALVRKLCATFSRTEVSRKCGISKQRVSQILEPHKNRARSRITGLILRGKLKRPARCQRCGCRCSPEAHHPDYSKPLVVRWLCAPCHRKVHFRNGH